MPVLSKPTGDEQLTLSSAVCLVQVAIGTSGACCLIVCTRLCVHDSRHAAHNGTRKPHMSISSHRVAQDVILKDEERKRTNSKKVVANYELDIIPNQSLKIWRRQESPSSSAKSRVVQFIQNNSLPILLEACTRGIKFLLLWHLPST